MPTKVDPVQTEALQKITGCADFNAQFHDRDGKVYPALIQHVPPGDTTRESEPFFRVWVAEFNSEVLFKASSHDGARERIDYYKLWYDPDGAQRQSRVSEDEAADIAAGAREHRCLLFTPHSSAHMLSPGDANEPYARAIKIPVVDLLVDFGDPPRRTRITHVGNVRHQRHAGARMGETRMPFYVECRFENAASTEVDNINSNDAQP